MRMTVFEGTPDEIMAVHRELAMSDEAGGREPSAPAANDDGQKFGSVALTLATAYDTLTRIRLAPKQLEVLRIIARAGKSWMHADTLQKQIGYSPSQFAGLMGAFGRRFTHSKGFKAGMWFFEQEWDADRSCYRYRLPDVAIEAMKKAGLQ